MKGHGKIVKRKKHVIAAQWWMIHAISNTLREFLYFVYIGLPFDLDLYRISEAQRFLRQKLPCEYKVVNQHRKWEEKKCSIIQRVHHVLRLFLFNCSMMTRYGSKCTLMQRSLFVMFTVAQTCLRHISIQAKLKSGMTGIAYCGRFWGSTRAILIRWSSVCLNNNCFSIKSTPTKDAEFLFPATSHKPQNQKFVHVFVCDTGPRKNAMAF